MNDQNLRNKWTEENISYLKYAYLKGSPLKQIAASLNRSVSAINKVLARHNLRTHSRMERIPSLPHLNPKDIQRKRNVGARIRKKTPPAASFLNDEYRRWVIFERVIGWMESQNVSVSKSVNDVYYEIDGFPKSKQQILAMANALREQQNLPIFFVEGITYM